MFAVKSFVSKNGKKVSALVYVDNVGHEHYVSFDRMLLCTILDCAPSAIDTLEGTVYLIGKEDKK